MGDLNEEWLLREACKAYGIKEEFVLASLVDSNGKVTILTHGGKRVSWSKGETVRKLTDIEVTGVNPENAKRKPITGDKGRK